MRATLADGRVVNFHFKVARNRKTICTVQVSGPDMAVSEYRGTARCDSRDEYDKATGKAKALVVALRKFLPSRADDRNVDVTRGLHNRAHRERIWKRFYDTLQTADVAFLDGCEKYL